MEEKNKDIEQREDIPQFVHRDGMLADKEYVEWVADVKHRYRQSQVKASVRVNTTMLEFYWSVGRDLVRMRAEQKWGSGVVKQFALDMRETFPNEKGFSYTNVKYMKRWYLFYYDRIIKGQQAAGLISQSVKSHQVGDLIAEEGKSHQVGDLLEMPIVFGHVPWKHHVQIFCNCESLEEAFFYINKVATEGWSRSYISVAGSCRSYYCRN